MLFHVKRENHRSPTGSGSFHLFKPNGLKTVNSRFVFDSRSLTVCVKITVNCGSDYHTVRENHHSTLLKPTITFSSIRHASYFTRIQIKIK